MTTVVSTFAFALTRAAGLDLNPQGEISHQGDILFRLGAPLTEHMPDQAYFDLIETIRQFHRNDPDLVFNYARQIRPDDLGTLGLAIKSAPTLRDSLQRLERYFRLITDTAVYDLDDGAEPALFRFRPCTRPHPVLHLRDECALAGVVCNIRALAGADLVPQYVSFQHDCRDDPTLFEAFFGCDVRFGAAQNAVAIARADLDRPNSLGDRAISDFFTRHLDADLENQPGPSSLKHDVLSHLSTRLSDGVPPASQVASELGMSERTFYRRLSEEDLSYRDVLQEAQSALAQTLLRDGKCSIAEIAFLTGFSEQSTFSRAFKRWVGEAPARFRQIALQDNGAEADWQTLPKPWQKQPISDGRRQVSMV